MEHRIPDEPKPPARQKDWPGPKLHVPLASVELSDGGKCSGCDRNVWVAYLVSVAKRRVDPEKWPFEPLFVWRYAEESVERYRLLDGWHRYWAAKIAGVPMAEVIVHPKSTTMNLPPPDDWRLKLPEAFRSSPPAEDMRPPWAREPRTK